MPVPTTWKERLGTELPPIRSREVLLRLLAWRLQCEAFGGLDAPTEFKLRGIAKALERDGSYEPTIRRELSPGVVLTREWKGVTHKVTVTAGGFQHQGKGYRSLMKRLGFDTLAAIDRINVFVDRVVVRLNRAADREFMTDCRALLADGELIEGDGQTIVLTLPVRAKSSGVGLPQFASRPDHTKRRRDRTWH
jgi:hypothetical protein